MHKLAVIGAHARPLHCVSVCASAGDEIRHEKTRRARLRERRKGYGPESRLGMARLAPLHSSSCFRF